MVVDEIRVRHAQQLLVVGPLEVWRRYDAVGDEVVDEVGAQGAGEAHVRELERGRSHRENLVARALGVAVEVDKDVDAVGDDAAGNRDHVHP